MGTVVGNGDCWAEDSEERAVTEAAEVKEDVQVAAPVEAS